MDPVKESILDWVGCVTNVKESILDWVGFVTNVIHLRSSRFPVWVSRTIRRLEGWLKKTRGRPEVSVPAYVVWRITSTSTTSTSTSTSTRITATR